MNLWAGYVAFYANNTRERIAYITLLAVNREMQGKGVGQAIAGSELGHCMCERDGLYQTAGA